MQIFLLQYFDQQIFACVVLTPSVDDGAGLQAELPTSDLHFSFTLLLCQFLVYAYCFFCAGCNGFSAIRYVS